MFTSCRRTTKQPAVEQPSQAENEACSINIEDESAEANIATDPSTSTFRQSNMNAFVKQPVTKARSEKNYKIDYKCDCWRFEAHQFGGRKTF